MKVVRILISKSFFITQTRSECYLEAKKFLGENSRMVVKILIDTTDFFISQTRSEC
jgi:hypothetical protein